MKKTVVTVATGLTFVLSGVIAPASADQVPIPRDPSPLPVSTQLAFCELREAHILEENDNLWAEIQVQAAKIVRQHQRIKHQRRVLRHLRHEVRSLRAQLNNN